MRFSSFALGLVAVSAALVAAAPVPSADTTALVQRANGDNKEQDASNQPNSSSGEEEGEDPVKKERKGSKSSGTHGSGTSSAASDDATTSDSDSMSDSDILKTLPPNKQKAYNAMTPAKKKEFMAKQREQLTTGGAASDKKIVCSLK